jgi:hypothetical protein
MKDVPNINPQNEVTPTPKKSYATPSVIRYGNLVETTENDTGASPDLAFSAGQT